MQFSNVIAIAIGLVNAAGTAGGLLCLGSLVLGILLVIGAAVGFNQIGIAADASLGGPLARGTGSKVEV